MLTATRYLVKVNGKNRAALQTTAAMVTTCNQRDDENMMSLIINQSLLHYVTGTETNSGVDGTCFNSWFGNRLEEFLQTLVSCILWFLVHKRFYIQMPNDSRHDTILRNHGYLLKLQKYFVPKHALLHDDKTMYLLW